MTNKPTDMSKISKTDEQLDKIIQDIEVKSLIAIQQSIKDSDPKHHIKMVAEAKTQLTQLINQKCKEELKKVTKLYNIDDPNEWIPPREIDEYIEARLKELGE